MITYIVFFSSSDSSHHEFPVFSLGSLLAFIVILQSLVCRGLLDKHLHIISAHPGYRSSRLPSSIMFTWPYHCTALFFKSSLSLVYFVSENLKFIDLLRLIKCSYYFLHMSKTCLPDGTPLILVSVRVSSLVSFACLYVFVPFPGLQAVRRVTTTLLSLQP